MKNLMLKKCVKICVAFGYYFYLFLTFFTSSHSLSSHHLPYMQFQTFNLGGVCLGDKKFIRGNKGIKYDIPMFDRMEQK